MLRPVRLVIATLALLTVVAGSAAETHSAAELWRMGRRAFSDGIYDVAEQQLRALVVNYPQSAEAEEATLLVGETLVLTGQSEVAVKWMAYALARYPKSRIGDAFHFWNAEALAAANQWNKAELAYAAVLETYAGSRYEAQAYYGWGYVLFLQKKLDLADGAFQTAQTKAGDGRDLVADAQVMIGRISLARQQAATAVQQFSAVTEHFPDTRAGTGALYWLGIALRQQGKIDAAVTAFEKALATPRTPPLTAAMKAQAWLALGELRMTQQRWPDAATALRLAFEQAPAEPAKPAASAMPDIPGVRRQAAARLGELVTRVERTSQVLIQLRQFVDQHPADPLVAPLLLRLADMAAAGKYHEQALADYQRLVAQFGQSPEATDAMAGAAWSLLALGRNAEAAQFFAMVTRSSKNPSILSSSWFKLGDLALAAGEPDKALEDYQHSLEAEPNGSHAADALWQLGLAASRSGKSDRAGAALEQLLSRFPNYNRSDEAWLQLGQTYVAQQKFAQAWQTFEKLWVGRTPSKLAVQARLAAAAAHEAASGWREAIAAYDELLAQNPPSDIAAQASFGRAHCLAASGDDEAAKTAFELLPKQYPNSPQAADAVFWLAQQTFNNKQWIEAQTLFATVAQKWPGHRLADGALYWAARAAMNRQAYKEARDILESLLQSPNARASTYRPMARMLEGETLAEEVKFAEALLVFESVTRDFPDSPQADTAWGRVGDCHYALATEDPTKPDLQRYQKAILAYRQVLNSLQADRAIKNQARCKIAQCFEKLGQPAEALTAYLEVVYDEDERGHLAAEPIWFCRAGLNAGALLETQGRSAEAAKLYSRIAQTGVTGSEDARQRLQKIQSEASAPK